MAQITLLDYAKTAHEAYAVAPEKMLSGSPQHLLSNHLSNAAGNFHVGFWEAEIGHWQVNYTEFEYCEILEGRIRMVASNGDTQIVSKGDRFVIEAGYQGSWEVLERAKKVYVIFEP